MKSNTKEGARSIQVEITPTSSRISRNAVTSLSIRGHRWKRHGETHWGGESESRRRDITVEAQLAETQESLSHTLFTKERERGLDLHSPNHFIVLQSLLYMCCPQSSASKFEDCPFFFFSCYFLSILSWHTHRGSIEGYLTDRRPQNKANFVFCPLFRVLDVSWFTV